ncbi:hypothetical protein SAMN05660971_00665 [Halomonas cupida]|uniref:Uncharacterized protein n=1 Tax=Halomonas cupida TaxID=44933 RepID=A0A1M7AW80_9GAMM|nr:hypothetical protein SAMN05660971_00665 [Halomonas cupida]
MGPVEAIAARKGGVLATSIKQPLPAINMAIKQLILIDVIVVRTTLAQMRGSAGVMRARVGRGTSLCRH